MKGTVMRLLGLLFVALSALFGQSAGSNIVIIDQDIYYPNFMKVPGGQEEDLYFWQIIKVNGVKMFYFGAAHCHTTFRTETSEPMTDCTELPEQTAFDFAPTDLAFAEFTADYADVPHNPAPIFIGGSSYSPYFLRSRPALTT